MWTIQDIIIALFIVAVIGGILTLVVRAMYPNRVVIDEPYGDATDTPRMIHETRRVNHERTK
jgi:hypothetical protein